MHHMECSKGGKRLSLTGTCITLFDENGFVIRRWFFQSEKTARKLFLKAC